MRKFKISKLDTKKYIIIAIILVVIVSTFALSRYMSVIAGEAGTRIAEFEVNIFGTGSQDIPLDLDLKFFNTTKLYDDEYFDEVAVVRNIRVVNNSEVEVNLKATLGDEMTEGLLWYVADFNLTYDYIITIKSALINSGYTTFDEDTTYQDLKDALEIANEITLNALNDTLAIKNESNSSRYLTLIAWVEHSEYIDADVIDEIEVVPFILKAKQITPEEL